MFSSPLMISLSNSSDFIKLDFNHDPTSLLFHLIVEIRWTNSSSAISTRLCSQDPTEADPDGVVLQRCRTSSCEPTLCRCSTVPSSDGVSACRGARVHSQSSSTTCRIRVSQIASSPAHSTWIHTKKSSSAGGRPSILSDAAFSSSHSARIRPEVSQLYLMNIGSCGNKFWSMNFKRSSHLVKLLVRFFRVPTCNWGCVNKFVTILQLN